ncbi:hypothetical protein T03_15176 [Trichinella britovi]|uniref:Uncharacterized protein n=1 Tax=Trichinella britovi TaxID=45882 RepID=A0A0V1D015_TRIBR|nr:hypothetical protein T03_15176 [Trichinella britovi]
MMCYLRNSLALSYTTYQSECSFHANLQISLVDALIDMYKFSLYENCMQISLHYELTINHEALDDGQFN